MRILRTDLYVGMFVITTVMAVVAALVMTSGIGVRRFDLYIRGDDATDIAVDTKIFLQGLEVGRVAAISAIPGGKPGRLEFVIRASLRAEFSDGEELRLPDSTDAEVVTSLLGESTLNLVVRGSSPDTLLPGDTILLIRLPQAMEAIGRLATDLKGDIQDALTATTAALVSFRRLADSLVVATGTARRFVAGIQPETEKTLQEATAGLARVRQLLDTADVRSGVTMRQLDATLVQARQLMANADSLTRLVTAMGLESRPEVREMMANLGFLSRQLLFVTEQLSRRPMRAVLGVELPDSLTAAGRARRAAADSARADSALLDGTRRNQRASQDTVPDP